MWVRELKKRRYLSFQKKMSLSANESAVWVAQKLTVANLYHSTMKMAARDHSVKDCNAEQVENELSHLIFLTSCTRNENFQYALLSDFIPLTLSYLVVVFEKIE